MLRRLLLAPLVALGCPGESASGSGREAAVTKSADEEGEDPAEPTANPLRACIDSASGDLRGAEALLRTLCAEVVRAEAPGAVLSIARRNGRTTTLAVGTRCATAGDRVRPDTAFRIGSVTKTLTAVAVAQQAAAHDVDLDAPIATHLPELDPRYGTITWRQLLDHTSGLPDTHPAPHLIGMSDAQRIAALTDRDPFDEAGRSFGYANAGYVLLGIALERISGRPALEHLRSLVAATSEDPAPSITADEVDLQHTACGHLLGRTFTVREDLALLAHGARWAQAAGGLVLSAPTLAAAALRVTDALRAEPPADVEDWWYAMGLRRRALIPDGEHWFHAGDTGDFSAELHLLPDSGVAVVVLTNGERHLRASAFAALAHADPDVDLAPP